MYYYGEGCVSDYEKSIDYFKKSAEKGDQESFFLFRRVLLSQWKLR
jgi:TPR repeat protein